MGIWEHAHTNAVPNLDLIGSHCPYCRSPLREHLADWGEPQYAEHTWSIDTVWLCPVCGWWHTYRQTQGSVLGNDVGPNGETGPYGTLFMASAGVLKNLSLRDIEAPIEEVRAFLTARFERRFEVHPSLMERTVASVFSDLGYSALVTGRSGDDGIDIVLSDSRSDLIGVQVKRYRDRIAVEQIRSLAGALILGGYTRGMFVTTSSFQAGASRTVATFADKGLPIELVDAPRFLDSLRVAQLNSYSERAIDDLPFNQAPTMCIARCFYACSRESDVFRFDYPRPAPWASPTNQVAGTVRNIEPGSA
jgi:restriction system protein